MANTVLINSCVTKHCNAFVRFLALLSSTIFFAYTVPNPPPHLPPKRDIYLVLGRQNKEKKGLFFFLQSHDPMGSHGVGTKSTLQHQSLCPCKLCSSHFNLITAALELATNFAYLTKIYCQLSSGCDKVKTLATLLNSRFYSSLCAAVRKRGERSSSYDSSPHASIPVQKIGFLA